MAQYRDIDLPSGVVLRVNGDLTIPSNNLSVTTGTISEGGVLLSAKYLGINAKATDSEKLDNLDSTQFMRSDTNTSTTGNLVISGTTKLAGAFYAGTTNPTNTNRLNFDGALYGTQLFDGAVRVAISTRSISTGSGLTGGGDLTADRTLSVSFGGNGSATTVAKSDHNHSGTYSNAFSTFGGNSLQSTDDRVTAPVDFSLSGQYIAPLFTTLNNDNATPYADAIVLSTYSDSSGGGQNMLLFTKGGSQGIYHRFGSWGGSSWGALTKIAYEKDVLMLTGGALTGDISMASNRILAKSIQVKSTIGDLVNNAPWYGVGDSNLTQAGAGGTSIQLAGYWGINIKTNNNELRIGQFNDSNGFLFNGNTVWHNGNFVPSQYVKNDTASQSVTGDFSLVGNSTLYVGTTATNSGSIVLKGSGVNAIQITGANTAKMSGVGVYMNASGNADFTGTVTANKIAVTDTTEVANLNAQKVGGKTEKELAKNESVLELGGYGVYTGTTVSAQTVPNMTVKIDAGTVYTNSGRRVTFNGLGSQSITSASATYGRLDVIYVQGSSAGVNEGSIGYTAGTPSASPVEPSIPSDAVKLAVISVPQNIGSIQSNQITDARSWKPMVYDPAYGSVAMGKLKTNTIDTNTTDTLTITKPIKGSAWSKSNTIAVGQTSATWTHNLNLASGYTITFASNSPNRHIYWSNKLPNSIVINIDDVTDVAIIVDATIIAT